MSKTKTTVTSAVYEIRPGVFAKGKPGERASTVVQRREDGSWGGVRGARPVIGEGARTAKASSALAAEIARLESVTK